MATTLKELAARAQVSITTASIVMNDRGPERAISAGTMNRVRKAAADLNYTPNLQAKSLRTRRTHCVGLVAALPLDTHTGRIVEGINRVCRKRDFRCVLATIDLSDDLCKEVQATLSPDAVDGLIIIDRGLDFAAADLAELLHAPRPTVVTGRLMEGVACCCDDFEWSGRIGTEDLYRNGYRDVLYMGIAGDAGFAAFMAGARQSAAAAGLEIPATRCHELPQREYPLLRPDASVALLGLLASDRPDAIVCFGDKITYGAHRALSHAGVAMPEEIALVGYGDFEGNFMSLTPAISAIRPPLRQMGEWTANRLIDAIAEPKRELDWPLFCAGDFTRRASSALARRGDSPTPESN